MPVSFGPKRSVLPPSNLGQNFVANRRVAEAAGRAAERTRIAVSVDGFPTRVWLRNPRGSVKCPCSSAMLGEQNPLTPTNSSVVVLDTGEGADLNAVDSGYPRGGPTPQPDENLPASAPEGWSSDWIDSIGHLLLGDGRRCGLCWGTGWIDGHRLYGGQRYLCCATSNPWVTVDPSSDVEVTLETTTPTMVGPGVVTWELSIQPGMIYFDAIRVRNGLRAAGLGWTLTAVTPEYPGGVDASIALGVNYGFVAGQCLEANQIPSQLTLTLEDGCEVSHVELVLRSEELINVQLPNLQMTASTELVAPFMQDEFEVDPTIGSLERGSIFEIPGFGGRLGSVWLVADVTENRTAQGVTWGIIGSARNVQPNEILACVSLEDSLSIGIIDPGLASRGFESTGGGVSSGLPNGSTDASEAANLRGTPKRQGGGSGVSKATMIVLDPSPRG